MMKRLKFISLILIGLGFTGLNNQVFSCTNYLITKGASVTGSTMITYAADSHVLYGELYFWPAADYPAGTMLDVYEWDTGKFLGQIPQVAHTFSVVGNMNENSVAIGETTYGGRSELIDTTGIIDYGSLIYITLQRAENARHAIKIMAELMNNYGYYSSGESFSISDPNEVWIMEVIGKGPDNKGAVWVARMIPDGYISGHANQARIQTFPMTGKTSISSKNLDKIFNPEVTTVYAKDVIDVAKQHGWFEGNAADFSFSDVYAPISFGGARFCDIRVWSLFKDFSDDMDQYFDYVSGHDLENRMPLWIKPNRKLSNLDVMDAMRDHLEGTPLDMSKDVGAGPFGLPYRFRPLTWSVEGDENSYCNERATATQQTGFSFVAESRSWLPNPIGGILWFGVDDASATVYAPFYCGMNEVPSAYKVGNGDMLTYSSTSAFWTFSFVSNFSYLRYNLMMPDVKALQSKMESAFTKEVLDVDKKAMSILEKASMEDARNYITAYSVNTGENVVAEWQKLGQFLLVKYLDGNVKKEKDGVFLRNAYGNPANPDFPGYSEEWKSEVIKNTGDKLKVVGDGH
ncbi:MAG: C69 family dipeptidase [Bacteroidales bacterium]|nr:C69 family dipeptidase [Bacteroidales bacterium]